MDLTRELLAEFVRDGDRALDSDPRAGGYNARLAPFEFLRRAAESWARGEIVLITSRG